MASRSVKSGALLLGIALAVCGGVIAYRSALNPPADTSTLTITGDGRVRETAEWLRLVGGLVMLVAGTLVALYAARRRRS